jgi:hypothetical protein
MQELSVPTATLDAEVQTIEGRRVMGKIFMPAGSAHHDGAKLPAEFMNDGDQFFAFMPEGQPTFLLNKQAVLVMTVKADVDHTESEDLATRRRITVFVPERGLTGMLLIEMPPERSRVLDALNGPETFLRLADSDRHHLIRKSAIIRVVEPNR